MRIVYSPRYNIDIGAHVFPTAKYRLLAERIAASGLVPAAAIVEPETASWEDLGLVHTPEYLERLRDGDFRLEELAQLEVAWSKDVVEGFRLMTGGTLLAARLAIQEQPGLISRGSEPGYLSPGAPVVVHLGGGLHHGFPDHGEGFCFFNDVAVAIRVLQRDRAVSNVAVIDLDVHHGNGTAFIFGGDPGVFTFSMHQEHNYPNEKPAGSLDIGLPDRMGDAEYIVQLIDALPAVFERSPDLIFYLAGADPFGDDQLGGLSLTKDGLRQRDRVVVRSARKHGIPLVVCLAGGYARRLADTVDIHYATVEEACRA